MESVPPSRQACVQLVPKLPAPLGDSVGRAAQSPLRSGARALGYGNHKPQESLIKSNSGRGGEVTFSVSALAAYHLHGLVPLIVVKALGRGEVLASGRGALVSWDC